MSKFIKTIIRGTAVFKYLFFGVLSSILVVLLLSGFQKSEIKIGQVLALMSLGLVWLLFEKVCSK